MSRTVLITGSAKGIGRSIAENFAKKQDRVVINYHHSEKEAKQLENYLSDEGYSVFAYQADITVKHQVEKMMEAVNNKFGPVEVLVNNAGIAQYNLLVDTTEEEWDHMMNVHLKGMYHCSTLVIPEMIRRKEGKIINISSIWGMVGASCEVSYSTAKAGMIGFTKALAKELGPSNIQVNCVAPGIIETDMIGLLNNVERNRLIEETPLRKFGKVEEIASMVFYLSSEEADFITGQVFSPNGGIVI